MGWDDLKFEDLRFEDSRIQEVKGLLTYLFTVGRQVC
jgi:hypothetical protein